MTRTLPIKTAPVPRRGSPLMRGVRQPGRVTASKPGLVLAAVYLLFVAAWLSLLGPIAPMLMMLATLAIFGLAPQAVFAGLLRCWPILLVAGLAPLSALWSTEPAVSLRYGIQLAITLVAAIAMASVARPRDLLRVFFFSTLIILVLCLLSGRQGGSPQGPVLIGVLGSKNEMGQLCQLAICSAMAIAFSSSEPRWMRLLALPAAAFAAFVLAYTFATGAVLTTLVFLLTLLVLAVGSRLPSGSKLILTLVVLAFAVPLWMIQADIMRLYEWFIVDVLGKDIGLTGRDYLWAHADRMISDRPVLGHGFRSTWLGTGTETIGLLRWAGLSSGAGFNFHDTYREWVVDFGFAGTFLIVTCLGAGMVKLIGQNLSRQATTAGLFLAASVVVLVARAKVETIYGPFGSSAILIGVTAATGYLSMGRKPASEPAGRSPPPRREARVRSRQPLEDAQRADAAASSSRI